MNNSTDEPSQPAGPEYKSIYMPAGNDEGNLVGVYFILKFQIITNANDPLTIKMKVELNPALDKTGAMALPLLPQEYQEYTFDDAGDCKPIYKANDYYLKGIISVVKNLNSPNGQFDNATKNFFFNIDFGKVNGSTQTVEGLFILMNIDSSKY